MDSETPKMEPAHTSSYGRLVVVYVEMTSTSVFSDRIRLLRLK